MPEQFDMTIRRRMSYLLKKEAEAASHGVQYNAYTRLREMLTDRTMDKAAIEAYCHEIIRLSREQAEGRTMGEPIFAMLHEPFMVLAIYEAFLLYIKPYTAIVKGERHG